jgi:hypothetical protein
MRLSRLALASALVALPSAAPAAITFVGKYEIAADATDRSGEPVSGGQNRLSIGSDWVFSGGRFYGITDRGPGGGVLDFTPRVHELTLDLDPLTGAVSGHNLLRTTLLRDTDGSALTGLNPLLASGNKGVLGKSFDSEGFVLLRNGNYLLADEYGPSVFEFDRTGRKVRAFETPANLVPVRNSQVNYVDTPNTGRQDNRGFEGITVSQDGTKAFAIMQDPLRNEGTPDGRSARFLRIVEFDIASGQSTAQYAYELESIDSINQRTGDDFTSAQQGRNIGVSSITALADGSFLVIERDNRGLGVEENGADPLEIGTKRVFRIRLDGATNIENTVLTGGALPPDTQAVSKELWLDVQAALKEAGLDSVEKLEGLTFGPQLSDGSLALYIVSDNDFSVTQNSSNVQFDVCAKPGVESVQVALGSACPDGFALIPTTIYAFRVDGPQAVGVVPEPATWAMMIGGFALVGAALRRRRLAAA